MSNDTSATAKVSIQVDASEIQLLLIALDEAGLASEKMAKKLLDADDAIKNVGAAAAGGSSTVRQYTDEFKLLVQELDKFSAASRKMAQEAAVANPLGGLDKSAISGLSQDDLQSLATTIQTKNFNPESAILQELSARTKAQADASALAAKQDTEWAAAESRLMAIQRQRAEQEATEANRINDIRAATVMAAQAQEQLAAAYKASVVGGRDYQNLSTLIDDALNEQAQSARQASAQLRAYLEEEAAAASRQSAESAGGGLFGGGANTSAAYSLMNTSFTLGASSTALLAADAAVVKTANDYQTAFAQVERTSQTSGAAADALRQQLVALSTTIPVSFENVAQIAALGGQLGISANSLVSFTKATAEFSATTNLTIDDAGTALGRLAQLMPGVGTQYDNLASSILKVGVNSVATESQIVNTAQRIAGVGTQAGLSATDIVGLSGALASLGVAPEAVQGSITRLFTKIQQAVADGGAALDQFGRVSGVTGQQFAQLWQSSPSTAILDLMKGIGEQGSNATGALNSLGLTASRDISNLEKLAGSTGVLKQALSDAQSGFANTSTLTDQYGKIAETTASKLQLLKNNWDALLATAGSSTSGVISSAVDGLNKVLQAFTSIEQNPIAQWFTVAAIGATALTGALGLAIAPMALMAANTLLLKGAMEALNLSEKTVAATTTALKFLTIGTSIAGVAGAAALAGVGIFAMAGAFQNATDKSNQFFSDTSALQSALQKDQSQYKANGDAIQTYSQASVTAAASASTWGGKLAGIPAVQTALQAATTSATSAINNQTLAYGKNAQAALENQIANSKAWQDLYSNKGVNSALSEAGGSLKGFLTSVLGDPENGGRNYIDQMVAAMKKELANSGSAAGAAGALQSFESQLAPLAGFAQSIQGSFGAATTASEALAAATSAAGNAAQTAGSQMDLSAKQMDGFVTTAYAGTIANQTLDADLQSLGDQFVTSGAQVAFSGSAMQKVIEEIVAASKTAPAAANNLQGFFNALVKGGYASAAQLSQLAAVIQQLGGATAPATVNIGAFAAGIDAAQQKADKASKSTQSLAKQVVTLADYANNLGGVMTRAFDIRTGPQTALDAISSGWSTIAKNAAAAADAEAKANATLATLASDRSVDEYWLKVAQMYGDTARATKLQADLTKNASDTSAAQTQLTDAQDKASTSLSGNSDAAIANRKALEDLVKNYQTYLTSLASSGASQDELKTKSQQLKQEFITQATQLGYNKTDVDNIAASFDDMTLAIQRVPRNITVAANTNPALEALNEFLAKAAASKATVPLSVGPVGGIDPITAGSNDGALYAGAWDRAAAAGRQIVAVPANVPGGVVYQLETAAGGKIGNPFFDTGGYTGPGGVHDVAGTVHAGEYVFNQAAVRNIGLGNLALLHSLGQQGTVSGGGGGGFGGVVALDQGTVMAIAEAVAQIKVVIPGVAIAKAVSNHNVSGTRRGI